MVKAILVLHYFAPDDKGREQFLGQRLLWVELPRAKMLAVLIDLLSFGNKAMEFKGSANFPSSNPETELLKNYIRLVFGNPFREIYLPGRKIACADSVRVVQIIDGWPWEEPYFSPVD